MLANLPAKRATRKLISLKDGFPRKRNTQNTSSMKQVQAKLNSNKHLQRHQTQSKQNKGVQEMRKKQRKPIVRKSVRNLNKVLSSKLIDSNSALIIKRKIKHAIELKRGTRSTLRLDEDTKTGEPSKSDIDGGQDVTGTMNDCRKKNKGSKCNGSRECEEVGSSDDAKLDKDAKVVKLKEREEKQKSVVKIAMFKFEGKVITEPSLTASSESGKVNDCSKVENAVENMTASNKACEGKNFLMSSNVGSTLFRNLSLSKKNFTRDNGKSKFESYPDRNVPFRGQSNKHRRNSKRKSAVDSFRNTIKRIKLRERKLNKPGNVQLDESSHISDEIPKMLPFFEKIRIDVPEEEDQKEESVPVVEQQHVEKLVDELTPSKGNEVEKKMAVDAVTPQPFERITNNSNECMDDVNDIHISNSDLNMINVETQDDISHITRNENTHSPNIFQQKSEITFNSMDIKSKKKRSKGLNDCIAMLTSKLQDRVDQNGKTSCRIFNERHNKLNNQQGKCDDFNIRLKGKAFSLTETVNLPLQPFEHSNKSHQNTSYCQEEPEDLRVNIRSLDQISQQDDEKNSIGHDIKESADERNFTEIPERNTKIELKNDYKCKNSTRIDQEVQFRELVSRKHNSNQFQESVGKILYPFCHTGEMQQHILEKIHKDPLFYPLSNGLQSVRENIMTMSFLNRMFNLRFQQTLNEHAVFGENQNANIGGLNVLSTLHQFFNKNDNFHNFSQKQSHIQVPATDFKEKFKEVDVNIKIDSNTNDAVKTNEKNTTRKKRSNGNSQKSQKIKPSRKNGDEKKENLRVVASKISQNNIDTSISKERMEFIATKEIDNVNISHGEQTLEVNLRNERLIEANDEAPVSKSHDIVTDTNALPVKFSNTENGKSTPNDFVKKAQKKRGKRKKVVNNDLKILLETELEPDILENKLLQQKENCTPTSSNSTSIHSSDAHITKVCKSESDSEDDIPLSALVKTTNLQKNNIEEVSGISKNETCASDQHSTLILSSLNVDEHNSSCNNDNIHTSHLERDDQVNVPRDNTTVKKKSSDTVSTKDLLESEDILEEFEHFLKETSLKNPIKISKDTNLSEQNNDINTYAHQLSEITFGEIITVSENSGVVSQIDKKHDEDLNENQETLAPMYKFGDDVLSLTTNIEGENMESEEHITTHEVPALKNIDTNEQNCNTEVPTIRYNCNEKINVSNQNAKKRKPKKKSRKSREAKVEEQEYVSQITDAVSTLDTNKISSLTTDFTQNIESINFSENFTKNLETFPGDEICFDNTEIKNNDQLCENVDNWPPLEVPTDTGDDTGLKTREDQMCKSMTSLSLISLLNQEMLLPVSNITDDFLQNFQVNTNTPCVEQEVKPTDTKKSTEKRKYKKAIPLIERLVGKDVNVGDVKQPKIKISCKIFQKSNKFPSFHEKKHKIDNGEKKLSKKNKEKCQETDEKKDVVEEVVTIKVETPDEECEENENFDFPRDIAEPNNFNFDQGHDENVNILNQHQEIDPRNTVAFTNENLVKSCDEIPGIGLPSSASLEEMEMEIRRKIQLSNEKLMKEQMYGINEDAEMTKENYDKCDEKLNDSSVEDQSDQQNTDNINPGDGYIFEDNINNGLNELGDFNTNFEPVNQIIYEEYNDENILTPQIDNVEPKNTSNSLGHDGDDGFKEMTEEEEEVDKISNILQDQVEEVDMEIEDFHVDSPIKIGRQLHIESIKPPELVSNLQYGEIYPPKEEIQIKHDEGRKKSKVGKKRIDLDLSSTDDYINEIIREAFPDTASKDVDHKESEGSGVNDLKTDISLRLGEMSENIQETLSYNTSIKQKRVKKPKKRSSGSKKSSKSIKSKQNPRIEYYQANNQIDSLNNKENSSLSIVDNIESFYVSVRDKNVNDVTVNFDEPHNDLILNFENMNTENILNDVSLNDNVNSEKIDENCADGTKEDIHNESMQEISSDTSWTRRKARKLRNLVIENNKEVFDHEKIHNDTASSYIKSPDLNNIKIATKIKSQLKLKVGSSRKTDKTKKITASEFTENVEEVYCDICDKTFVRSENLVKHKRTLTHIAKLSEIEAREAANKRELEYNQTPEGHNKMNINISDILQQEKDFDLKSDMTNNQFGSPFTLNPNSDTLKLADIINDVLNKPVGNETMKHNSYGDISGQGYAETTANDGTIAKRCKSLGERKSFESDLSAPTYLFANPIEPVVIPLTNSRTDVILKRQISILENIIEQNQGSFRNVDDISLCSNKSLEQNVDRQSPALSDASVTKPEENEQISFTHNANIMNTFMKPLQEENFIKPSQYEEISNDSSCVRNNYEDQRSRKVLNRDEELFLECCSLLKSSSEMSNTSKPSLKIKDHLNNFGVKQTNIPNWMNKKSFASESADLKNEPYPESCPNSPLGDGYGNDLSNSNSNTIDTDWNLKAKQDDCVDKPLFEDISLDEKDSFCTAKESDADRNQNNFSEFKVFGSKNDTKANVDVGENDYENIDENLKKNMVSRFGGWMTKALKNSLQVVTKSKHR